MAKWFEGTSRVSADLPRIGSDLKRPGRHFEAVVQHMPGLKSSELKAEDGDAVTIKTREGVMRRSNIVTHISDDVVRLEFDEEYDAGKMKASSHFRHEFVPSGDGAEHKLQISDVRANGVIGWVYRTFGARNIGKAVLASYAQHFNKPRE